MAKMVAFKGGQSSPLLIVVSGTCLTQTCLLANKTSFGVAEGRVAQYEDVKRDLPSLYPWAVPSSEASAIAE